MPAAWMWQTISARSIGQKNSPCVTWILMTAYFGESYSGNTTTAQDSTFTPDAAAGLALSDEEVSNIFFNAKRRCRRQLLESMSSMVLCGAVWCSMMLCGALWCFMVLCDASVMLCGALWYSLMLCGALWCFCGALWCSVLQNKLSASVNFFVRKGCIETAAL